MYFIYFCFVTEPSVLSNSLLGHNDAIWGLSIHSQRIQLLSCSADGTVRLWNPQTSKQLASYTSDQGMDKCM